MTMSRRQLVDVAVTRYYHCISRCVRRAFLCGEGVTHRKAWIEARLELLAKHFAISVCGCVLPASLRIPCGVRAAGGRMSAQSTSGSPSP